MSEVLIWDMDTLIVYIALSLVAVALFVGRG